jgi:hypothetical protein
MLVPPTSKIGSEVFEMCNAPRLQIPLNNTGGGVIAECSKDRSMVEVLQSKPQLKLEDRLCVEEEKGGVKQRHAVEGVLESTALATGYEKMM